MSTTNQLLPSVEITIKDLTLTRIGSISIDQTFDDHHRFEISLSPDMLPGKSVRVDIKELAEQVVGEAAVIKLRQGIKQPDSSVSVQQSLTFKGLATTVRLSRASSGSSAIVISGVSPTALLGAGRTNRSFTDKNLSGIVGQILGKFGSLSFKNSPSHLAPIHYATQYQEDNFHFLQRLARQYGEWMFYDGPQLVFGKKGREKGEEVKLVQGKNLFDIQYNLRVAPLNAKGFHYDYFTHQTHEAEAAGEQVAGLGTYAQVGLRKSEKLFKDELYELGFQDFRKADALKKAVRHEKSGQANHLAVLTGLTTEMELKLGSPVRVADNFLTAANTAETIDYGAFVITQLNHFLDERGTYKCQFEGVPQDTDFAPLAYCVQAPQAQVQPAVVMKVDDKGSLGRVKVQFPWQKADNEMTPWVRVVNPMASKEKGMYFVPEVGEVVFVDFEFGNPDMPFVTGSMYHGENKPGALFSPENNIKGIITKGGNHILIDDSQGKERIRIFNKENKNEIELTLDGEPNIRAKSKGTIFLEAEKGIELKAPKIKLDASDEWEVKAGKTQIKNDQGMQVSAGKDIAINAQNGVTLEGQTVDLSAKSGGSFKSSTQLELEGGAKAVLKGGVVMIN